MIVAAVKKGPREIDPKRKTADCAAFRADVERYLGVAARRRWPARELADGVTYPRRFAPSRKTRRSLGIKSGGPEYRPCDLESPQNSPSRKSSTPFGSRSGGSHSAGRGLPCGAARSDEDAPLCLCRGASAGRERRRVQRADARASAKAPLRSARSRPSGGRGRRLRRVQAAAPAAGRRSGPDADAHDVAALANGPRPPVQPPRGSRR